MDGRDRLLWTSFLFYFFFSSLFLSLCLSLSFSVIPELSALVLYFILQLYSETSPIKVLASLLQELHRRHKIAKPVSVGKRSVGFLKRRDRSSERLCWWYWWEMCTLPNHKHNTYPMILPCWDPFHCLCFLYFFLLIRRYQFSASQLSIPVVPTCVIKFSLLYFCIPYFHASLASSEQHGCLFPGLWIRQVLFERLQSYSLLEAISTYKARNYK